MRIDSLNYLLGGLFRERREKARCSETIRYHRRSDVSKCNERSCELHEVFPDLDIQGLTVRTQERIAFNKEEKFSVLDVLIKDSKGRRYDIEMQVHRKKTWINEHATTCIR